MRVIIDRFEEKYAVVEMENGSFVNMPRELVPNMAEPGEVLEIQINEEETERRRNRIQQLLDGLSEK